jgi:hypothetical protein
MLPFNCVTDMQYPFQADIYYSFNTQDQFGTINRTWFFDRTIKCYLISKSINRDPELTPDLLMKFKDDLTLRTPENIRIASNDDNFPLTEILVTNLRNQKEQLFWNEYGDEFAGVPTVFEVRTVTPVLDPFQNLDHYFVYIARSQNQSATLEANNAS